MRGFLCKVWVYFFYELKKIVVGDLLYDLWVQTRSPSTDKDIANSNGPYRCRLAMKYIRLVLILNDK